MDPDRPIPRYVLDGAQPRDEDCVFFVKTVMPFGWRLSVDYWVRLSKALKALHLWDECPPLANRVPRGPDGERLHDAGVYVDDTGVFAVEGFGQLAQDRFLELCALLRIPVSETKLAAEGAVGTELAMLGVIFDFVNEELRLSPERLATVKRRVAEMRDKSYCSREEYDSLVGVLSFCASCVPGGRTFMHSLYKAQWSGTARQRKRRGSGGLIRLRRGVKTDLAWWLRFIDEYNGASMMVEDFASSAEELGLFTDASLEGFGACFVFEDGTAEYFGGLWSDVLPGIDTSQETGEWHISELEQLSVLMAVHQWRSELAQRRVVMRCDNESAVTAINRGYASDPGMHACVRELWLQGALGGFKLGAKHVTTDNNVLADNPSRWTRADGSRDPKYEAEFFDFAKAYFGLEPSDLTEVRPAFDTLGMLRRMRKAHRGKVHRLNAEGGGDGDDDGVGVLSAEGRAVLYGVD